MTDASKIEADLKIETEVQERINIESTWHAAREPGSAGADAGWGSVAGTGDRGPARKNPSHAFRFHAGMCGRR